MKATFGIIELCAGTAAVARAALGCPAFPTSRIGSKAGYAAAILSRIGIARVDRALLVEADPRIARILAALFGPGREQLAAGIDESAERDARAVWNDARHRHDAVGDLLWLAGARGGVGRFKGGHVRRPSVDGFIPSRSSISRRVRAFAAHEGAATVVQGDASSIDPHGYTPTTVYIDPPYVGREGYAEALCEPVEALADRWAQAGHRVFVSEVRPLNSSAHDITRERRGQSRRSLTRDCNEWLSSFTPRAA